MAVTFAGTLLGAGYVSGQELWQYFGCYGEKAIMGICLSLLLIALISFITMVVCDREGIETMDEILIRWNIPWLRSFANVLLSSIYGLITIVMLAGLSSLFTQILGINKYISSLIAIVPVMICVYFGIEGMLTVFSAAVPVLVIASVCICGYRINSFGLENIRLVEIGTNPLLGGWVLSALNYAALNVLGAFGILAPVSKLLKKKNDALFGIILGFTFLLVIAIGIITALSTNLQSTATDLPMLDLARTMSPFLGDVYAFLLFLGMFGNAIATLVAVLRQMEGKIRFLTTRRLASVVILGVFCYIISLTGFSKLVGTVYPVLGYIGMIAIVLLLEHFLSSKKP